MWVLRGLREFNGQLPPLQALLATCGFMQGAFDKIYQNNDKKMNQNKGSSIFEFKIKSKK